MRFSRITQNFNAVNRALIKRGICNFWPTSRNSVRIINLGKGFGWQLDPKLCNVSMSESIYIYILRRKNSTNIETSQRDASRTLSYLSAMLTDGKKEIKHTGQFKLSLYWSVPVVIQFRKSLGCSSVGGGAPSPSFPRPIHDTFNCEFVNQMIYDNIIERNWL